MNELIHRDLQHIWHPCSQMKDYETLMPLMVARAYDSYMELTNGRKIIDAISSWWCKSLGHAHPRLQQALLSQLQKFEHVILANTTNETIVKLSEKLAQLTPSLKKVFYAGDGSCAVEIALKMSLHARQIKGESKRTRFIALENGYHGETIAALSVSDVGMYRDPYRSILFDTHFISSLPYVLNVHDPRWLNCEKEWEQIEKKLTSYKETTTAIIIEPIVQGAGGMKIYSQDFLRRLYKWSRENNIHLIADEIMTGIGRTGKMLACSHAEVEPDFICLSKGLTSGWMSFSVVLTHDAIYDIFYDDFNTRKAFLHSHTYSGNALAASIALEVLTIMQEDNMCEKANFLGKIMLEKMNLMAERTGKLKNIRQLGAMVAADLILKDDHADRRLGFEVYQAALKDGAMLRPLGNTIYWLPPLTTSKATIDQLAEITEKAILAVNF